MGDRKIGDRVSKSGTEKTKSGTEKTKSGTEISKSGTEKRVVISTIFLQIFGFFPILSHFMYVIWSFIMYVCMYVCKTSCYSINYVALSTFEGIMTTWRYAVKMEEPWKKNLTSKQSSRSNSSRPPARTSSNQSDPIIQKYFSAPPVRTESIQSSRSTSPRLPTRKQLISLVHLRRLHGRRQRHSSKENENRYHFPRPSCFIYI